MEQWSILSNIVNYIQFDRHPKNFYNLNIRVVNKEKYKRNLLQRRKRQMLQLDFGDMSEKVGEEYLDIYEGIESEILNTTRFDENLDLSTTYLGKVATTSENKIKAEENFLISEQRYPVAKLLDGTEWSNIIGYQS